MAILVLGVGVVSSYSLEKEIILAPDDSIEFGDQVVKYESSDDS